MESYKISKQVLPVSMVEPQKYHTQFEYYAKDPDFFEFADFLMYPIVVKQDTGKYLVWHGLEDYYLTMLKNPQSIHVYVLEDLPVEELTYFVRETEHTQKRLRLILDTINLARIIEHPALINSAKDNHNSYYRALAEITDKPDDFIRKLDALCVYSPPEVWSGFYEGTIELEDALHQTFEVV